MNKHYNILNDFKHSCVLSLSTSLYLFLIRIFQFPSLKLSQSCKIYVQPQGKRCRSHVLSLCITMCHSILKLISIDLFSLHRHAVCSTKLYLLSPLANVPYRTTQITPICCSCIYWPVVSLHRLESSGPAVGILHPI